MSSLNNNAFLKDENILTLLSLNNLIVPEIQREYVWGNNETVLKHFLSDIKESVQICSECGFAHGDKYNNIGFLYSYKPPYVELESGRYLDEFLIDGQQRITTIFLLLLSRAVHEDCLNEFLSICRADEQGHTACFSYKVRSLTQSFLDRLILHVQEDGTANAFSFVKAKDYPSWLLSDYLNDPTIEAILKTIRIIEETFTDDNVKYFDYILRSIHFWHFKTEATSQGEDLYITMNSRGEQLSRNEMQKADLLPSDKLVEWGVKWEDWQTYFWKMKGKNENADTGFNSYLSCIEGLENFMLSNPEIDILSLSKYMEALVYLTSNSFAETVANRYPKCSDWFSDFIKEVKETINSNSIDWAITKPDPKNPETRKKFNNQAPAKNRAMLMWPWMYYYVASKDAGIFSENLFIRIIHFYFVRFHCYKRSVTTIKKIIDALMNSGQDKFIITMSNDCEDFIDDTMNSTIFSDEEVYLSKVCANNDFDTLELENAIWKLQTCPEILDGRDVGGDSFYGFVSAGFIGQSSIIDDFALIDENFRKIIHTNKSQLDLVRRILLYYPDGGVFWRRWSPGYYFNYETSIWKRIIRTKPFLDFYREFVAFVPSDFTLSTKDILTEFLQTKQADFLREERNRTLSYKATDWSHRRVLAMFDIIIDNVWSKYENIAFYGQESGTRMFENQLALYEAKRYYDNPSHKVLPETWQDILKNKCETLGLSISFADYPTIEPLQPEEATTENV